MLEARVVLASHQCRPNIPLPPAPFMFPGGLEHCGMHISATAAHGNAAPVRGHMRRWLARFMGSGASDSKPVPLPESFVDLGAASIYYFSPFTSRELATAQSESRLDLARVALGNNHPLCAIIAPQVVQQKSNRWLDNHRVEITIRRTSEGFVRINAQVLSLLYPAGDISIRPLANTTSSITVVGPTKQQKPFMLRARDQTPTPLAVPEEFYAAASKTSAQLVGTLDVRTSDFASFHPSLQIATHQTNALPATEEGCRLEVIVALPKTYFFDPYQLQERLSLHHEHHGPVELERPAEVMDNWGSLLVLSQKPPPTDLFNVTVPIHSRYRLPPIPSEATVGYHGEPIGDSHVDLALLPPIAAIVCPIDSHRSDTVDGSLLGGLEMRPALFGELGLRPIGLLEPAVDIETLLRMPVGYTENPMLIQALTLAALFAGTIFICMSVKAGTANPCQPAKNNK
ncbi:protease B nonderepressible form [Coemansia thaxteri]|nr:protease B nonderepressible form [Coemansia thaxteri]